MGNWKTFSNDQTGPPSETRNHNVQNQITSLSGTGLVTPTYDANGNSTKDEWNNNYTFDAWNRLAQATTSGGTLTYTYDALNRRVVENPGSVTDLYYSKDWQLLEERPTAQPLLQYVWSPLYVDALVLRDTNGQRLYVQQDANWNVTAIISSTGAPQERYVYDPHGKPTILNPLTWAVTGSGNYGTSNFGWVYLHQGGRYTRFDDLSGLYYFRHRDLSPTLGRWMQQDPMVYVAGDEDLYGYLLDGPINGNDPDGLDRFPRRQSQPLGGPPRPPDPLPPGWPPGDQIYVQMWPISPDDVAKKTAQKCGCDHCDISTRKQGKIRQGFGGGERSPANPRPPKPNDIILDWNPDGGKIQAGSGRGTPCKRATYADIVDCIKNYPKPTEPFDPILNNCVTDVVATIRGSCLKGWSGGFVGGLQDYGKRCADQQREAGPGYWMGP